MSSETLSKKYLALIPARGGSKRLPLKNMMEIQGQSLVRRALDSATGAGPSVTICLSTDDEKLATEGLKYGDVVPFMRPAHLASDNAKSFDVVLHAIDWFYERGCVFDAVIVLQPTSPLRTSDHVREAVDHFEKKDAHGVVSVCEAEHPPEWMARLGRELSMESFGANLDAQKRSQDYTQAYRLNGAIYIYDVEEIKKNQGFFYSKQTYAYVMDQPSSVDIDTYEDYLLATFWAERKGANQP